MTRTAAIAELRRRISADEEPEIDDSTVESLVDASARAAVYGLETACIHGKTMILEGDAFNGRYYTCEQGGVTGATAPQWPYRGVMGQRVYDGTVIWRDSGPAFESNFDLDAAEHEGWLEKARHRAHLVNVKDKDINIDMDGTYKKFLEMAARVSPQWIF